jgi:uncharacterized protein
MTLSNVDVVRGLYESFNSGAPAGELADPEIEWVNPPDAVEPGTRRGTSGWNDAVRNVHEGFGEARVEVEHMTESGDKVAVEIKLHVRGERSGVEGTMPQSHLWTIRDGRAVRFEWFTDPDRALAILADRQ